MHWRLKTGYTMRVVTLIPAYKVKYAKELFLSLAVQSRASDRIIVSDDSPKGEFAEALRSPQLALLCKKLPIEVHAGPRLGAYANFKHLVKLWNESSDLVHLLLDDDVIYPEFYEFHLATHASGIFSCSVSGRWYANEPGQPVAPMPVPREIRGAPARFLSLTSDVLFKTTVPTCNNWLGEFSNCVMTPRIAQSLHDPELDGVSYAGLWDLGAFVAASDIAPVVYLQDRMGSFRTGPHHQSANMLNKECKAGHLAWLALAIVGHRRGHVSLAEVQGCCERIGALLKERYASEKDMSPFLDLAPKVGQGTASAFTAFVERWNCWVTSA